MADEREGSNSNRARENCIGSRNGTSFCTDTDLPMRTALGVNRAGTDTTGAGTLTDEMQ